MSSLPIAPDESSGEPRCVATCPSATRAACCDSEACDCGCIDCEVDQVQTEGGLLCLPRVRELVAISRRRCDGCSEYVPHEHRTARRPDRMCCQAWGYRDVEPHESCSRWEAKP